MGFDDEKASGMVPWLKQSSGHMTLARKPGEFGMPDRADPPLGMSSTSVDADLGAE